MAPIEEMLTIAPLRRARMPGSAALISATGPKKLVANSRRTSAGSPSSTAARYPYPALLTSTSMPPKASSACRTAAATCSSSVTSSVRASAVSGYAFARSAKPLVSRAVIAAFSPRSSTAWASARPRPAEQPVMNQVDMPLTLGRDSTGLGGPPSTWFDRHCLGRLVWGCLEGDTTVRGGTGQDDRDHQPDLEQRRRDASAWLRGFP